MGIIGVEFEEIYKILIKIWFLGNWRHLEAWRLDKFGLEVGREDICGEGWGWTNSIFDFGRMRNLRFSIFEAWCISGGIRGHP